MAVEHIPFAGINLEILKILSDWSDYFMKQPIEHQWSFYYKLRDSIMSRWDYVSVDNIYPCFKGEDWHTLEHIFSNRVPHLSKESIWKPPNKKTILKLLTLWVIMSSTNGSRNITEILGECPYDNYSRNVVMGNLWKESYGMNEDMTDGVLRYISDDLRLITGNKSITQVEHWAWAEGLWDTGTFIPSRMGGAEFKAQYDSEVERLFTSPQQFFMNWKSNPF